MKTKEVYFNRAQQYLMALSVRILYVIASRRLGKTEGIIMPTLLRNIQQMPRGQHAFIASTYKQALTRTIPGILHALKRLGYNEGMHYFVGRKAPDKMGFSLPYIEPKDWSHYIHWYNGSVTPIISQDVPYSSNSLSLSSVIADEAKTLSEPKLIDETLPAITPMVYFQNCPWDGSQTYVSDMPTAKSGLWLLNKEKQMDKTIIEVLEGLIVELYNLKQISTDSLHYRKRIKEMENEIAFFRKEAILFVYFSILENLEVVGEQYVKDRYRDLPLSKFLTSIMSYKLKFTEGGFYGALSEKLYYSAYDITFLERFRKSDGSINYEEASRTKFNCKQDVDINLSQPLYIGCDTNIAVNGIVVGQPDYSKGLLRTINVFQVKGGRMLPEVCEELSEYYQPLPHRNIVFYFDHTFLQGRSGISTERFNETIIRVLTAKGWNVFAVYIGNAMEHNLKHKEIDQGMKGQKNLKPLFNRHNCADLIDAMEKTTTIITSNGWGKDKRDEKLPDSEDDPVEKRTHITDAWDTLYIGCSIYRSDHIASGISTSMKM